LASADCSKKNKEPKYHEKKVVAHPDDELNVLYCSADAEETFLLDFFIGSMARDCEACGCRYSDVTGTTLTLYGKQHKTRTDEISPRLADAINARRKRSNSGETQNTTNPRTRLCSKRTNWNKTADLMSSLNVERKCSQPDLYLGTFAFSAAGWRGSFYPTGMHSREYLTH